MGSELTWPPGCQALLRPSLWPSLSSWALRSVLAANLWLQPARGHGENDTVGERNLYHLIGGLSLYV